MKRGLLSALVVLAVGAALLPAPRGRSLELVSSALPWVTGEGSGDPAAAAAASPAGGDPSEVPATADRPPAPMAARGPTGVDDGHAHTDGPPDDLEISDDLPIPPLAPEVGTASGGVARPATPTGPHWVPFKGNRILWCVYRGAGRCDGHHPYPAIDVDLRPGTPIYAAGPGTVYESCNRGDACGGYGNHVRIRHPNNVRSIYGHFTKAVVRRGQTVRTGTLIGYSGCTGRCNGAHLHYEERNAADQSIQLGQMQGYSGSRVVTYPNVWGYSSWTGIPPDRLRIRNDFFPEDDRDDDGTLDRHERCLSAPGPTWTSGCPLPRRAPDSGDAATTDGAGNLRHHLVDETGAVWQLTRFTRGWAWTDLGAPGAGAEPGGVVSTKATGGAAWVAVIDRAGSLWAGRTSQGPWQWVEIGTRGGGLTGPPALAAGPDGSVVVHAVDIAGSLWRARYGPETEWVWEDLGTRGGGFAGSVPTSYFTGENETVTALADRTGGLHLFTLTPSGTSGVVDVAVPGGGLTGARPALIADRAGLLSVFALGRDGHLRRYLRSYGGVWVWIDHGLPPGGDGGRGLTAWRTSRDDLVVAGVDAAGTVRATIQTGTLSFSWRTLGRPASQAGGLPIASGVAADGVGQVFLTVAEGVHRFEARGSWPGTTHATAAPGAAAG